MAGRSRVNEMVAESSAVIREKVDVICDHWREMYVVDDDFLKRYLGRIKAHLVDILSDIEDDVRKKKHDLAVAIESCLEEKEKIERELGKLVRPPDFPEGAPLQQILSTIQNGIHDLRRERTARIAEVNQLKQEQLVLCNLLDEPPYELIAELPSAEELEGLKFRVNELQVMKVHRQEELRPLKARLQELVTVLELEPSNELEKAVLQNDVESLPITSSRMAEVQQLLAEREQTLRTLQEEVDYLKNELERLWNRVDVPQGYRDQFLVLHAGIGRSAMDAMVQERERCEELKRATIQPIIERLRKDIADLHNLLTFTEEQRSGFNALRTQTFSEDVLDLHELEYARLLRLYSENRQILELAEERRKTKEEYDRLEDRYRNPDRLKNRGGLLLVEEKERKSVSKSLLKIDSKLKAALVSYYEKHDSPFLWWGEDLLAKVTKDELEHPSRTTPRKAKNVSSARKENLPSRLSSKSSYTTLSSESISSYSQFQEQIESGSSRSARATPIKCTPKSVAGSRRFCTPVTRSATSRLPLRQYQPSPHFHRAHSSPSTPKRLCSKPSPRRATPRKFGLTLAKTSLHF